MKTTTTTDQQSKAIINALQLVHAKPFCCESGDPKANAQRNLRGRTHYVDDDTLRWHKSRITSSGGRFGGLLFTVTCSDALDMNNTKRGFRVAVFDVFGTTVYRPDLENAKGTSAAAQKAAEESEIDLVAHYREALQSIRQNKINEAKDLDDALSALDGVLTKVSA